MVQSNVNRIGKIILLGTEGKRRTFFEKAIAKHGVDYAFYDYDSIEELFQEPNLADAILKIDPPLIRSTKIADIQTFTKQYENLLDEISKLPVQGFLNAPATILTCLDKRTCKKILMDHEILVTNMFDATCRNHGELLSFMGKKHLSQVFVKPVNGSGAAGVTGVRYSNKKHKLVIYTCATLSQDGIQNTKKMIRLEDEKAADFLDSLLRTDCVIEKWHVKAKTGAYSYDLRVIVIDGEVVYLLPRLSKGPITNLHLNNHAAFYEELGLDETLTEEIKELCIRAVSCFPGLTVAGIDVLLEHGKPRIIEMNGQGDLIYQDIFQDNKIYDCQVKKMREMMKQGEQRNE